MYIDQLTLFILAEIAVVYVVITVFIFYRQRLYHILAAILKEMRWEKLRRQQEKQQEIAALRAQNRKLATDYKTAAAVADSAGKTIPEQLRQHLEQLEADVKERGGDLHRTPEPDEPSHIHWLRRNMLRLEQQLLAGEIDDDEWASQAHLLLKESGLEAINDIRRDDANSSLSRDQLTEDLNQYKSQYSAARDRIRLLEQELTKLKSITEISQTSLERPEKGGYADELYKLKCDKYDMQETINRLSLKLQKIDPEGDEFAQQQAELINALNQYVKDADVSINLLEKELDTVNHENIEFENEVHNLKNRLKDMHVRTPQAGTPDHVKNLSANATSQSESVASLRDTLEQLRSGEAPERALEIQEEQISRLELLVRDSESCVAMLEMELLQAHQELEELNSKNDKGDSGAAAETQPRKSSTKEFGDIRDQIKLSLDGLRNLTQDLRDGGDTADIIAAQEKEIDHLQSMLASTEAIIEALNDPAKRRHTQDARPESNEDIEEMESLVKQFMSDSQTMLHRIKELEKNQQAADKAASTA